MFIRVLLVNLRTFMITQHRNQTKLCLNKSFPGVGLILGGKGGDEVLCNRWSRGYEICCKCY